MYNINYISHFHDEIELIYVADGSVSVTTTEKLFVAQNDEICIFMPGEIHSFATDLSNHLYVIKINCENSRYTFPFSEYRCNNLIKASDATHHKLKSCILRLHEEINDKNDWYSYAANSISNEILSYILKSGILKPMDLNFSKSNIRQTSFLKAVTEYISSNYMYQISLGNISEYFNFSKYYFSRMFKEITHTTFYNFLTIYRLEKSLEMLKTGAYKRDSIAIRCGFCSTRAYYRAFKQYYHMTPGEFLANPH